MLDINDDKTRAHLLEGNFGLEREALRITAEGRIAHTPHPFPGDNHIVRDFCENQTEINTGVHGSATEAVAELEALDAKLRRGLAALKEPEYLWPFSNPPFIESEADIPTAQFEGDISSKTAYREYLAGRYGRYLMTLCGIHVNFSFSPALVAAGAEAAGEADLRRYGDKLYLHVAEQAVKWGWVLTPLTAASPLLDGSFLERGRSGREDFIGMASVRCSDLGYWNHFVPDNDFSSVRAYADRIRAYVQDGMIVAPSELYYPIRLKPRGRNNLTTLVAEGIDHIELRSVDLNPLRRGLVDVRDVEFAHLLLVWCACQSPAKLQKKDQFQAVKNFKNAARYDLESSRIAMPDGSCKSLRRAGIELLVTMRAFFGGISAASVEIVDFELDKFVNPQHRYAPAVRERFGSVFAEKGLQWAKEIAHV